MTEELVQERRGNVVVLRLNRPEAHNALSPSLISSIGGAIIEAESDRDVRAIVLTATGDRVFSAGMDLRAFAAGESMPTGETMDTFLRHMRGETAVPVVGAANATALAGGLELLLGCDVIVASSDAVFGLPEVKRGLFAAGGGTALGRRLPLGVAMELLLTGDTITAARAYEVGLVNAVVRPAAVLSTAVDFAERIAANGPLGLRASKELARLAMTDPARWSQRHQELQVQVFGSEDAKEGATAFVEKRPPVWRGR